jgi:hypothetical protein
MTFTPDSARSSHLTGAQAYVAAANLQADEESVRSDVVMKLDMFVELRLPWCMAVLR